MTDSYIDITNPITDDAQKKLKLIDNGDGTYSFSTSDAAGVSNSDLLSELQALNSMVPGVYDHVSLSYTGDNLTGVVFKTGGSGGTTVSTLTLGYDGSDNLITVTRT